MTITPAKLRANRRNAQKSTGPKTPVGKAASKLNALKHGVLAQNVIVRGGQFKESPAEFTELCHQFYASLMPSGPLEELLVDQIVQASWRLRRARIAESGEIALSVDEGFRDRQQEQHTDHWLRWEASGNVLSAMENSGVGNRILSQWLRKVKTCVEEEGELSEAALKIPFFGEPNRLSDELKKWQQQCPPPAPGMGPATHREETKKKLLAKIGEKLHLLYSREEECRRREQSTEQARQSADVLPSSPSFERILRYETALERELYRAMNQLERLQRRRQGEAVPAPLAVDVSGTIKHENYETNPKANCQTPIEINASTP